MSEENNLLDNLLENALNKFDEKLKVDEKFHDYLKDDKKNVLLDITDSESYYFDVSSKGVSELKKGDIENPDVVITASEDILSGILNKQIKPLKAYVKKQIKFKASLQDMLFIKKLL